MKKVAIFINSLRGGGAERIVSYLLSKGHERFEFHLVLLHRDIVYEIPDIKIVELEGEKSSKFSSIFKLRLLAKRFKNYLEENNIDTVLSLLNRPNLIACHLKKMGWKGKLIISERADTIAYYKTVRFGWYMIRLVKKYYPYADVVTAISKGIARSLAKLGISDVTVIYNPIIIENSVPEVRSNKPFTFINIARLDTQKNHILLLNAFAKLPDKNTRLVILGKGPLMDKLKGLAFTTGINKRVHFEGFQKDIYLFLKDSDCFVFSSDYEGLGNVIIEALAAGLPVISTDCPYGPREILAPETDTDTLIKEGMDISDFGILTPVGQEIPLAAAMQKMIDDRAMRTRFQEKAAIRAGDFNIHKISEQYFSLF